MEFSAEGLPKGLKLDAGTGRITGSVAKRGKYIVTLRARNALGEAIRELRIVVGDKLAVTPPNDYGWDVKRKLVWLGSRSYMFRALFRRYMLERCDGQSDIGHTDDFICQECTRWSGLGVIDILAGVLDIDDNDRKDLRSWYERHAAPYMILSARKSYR